MNPRILLMLRLIFGTGLLVVVAVQILLLIKMITDTLNHGELSPLPLLTLATIILAGLTCVDVVIICVLRLLHLVSRQHIFNQKAFRWLDTIAIAIAISAALVPPAGYLAAQSDDGPGFGVISLVPATLLAGVALLVYVQRTLLAQAVSRDLQASELEFELDGVI